MSYKPDAKSIEIANLIAEIDSKIQARAKPKKKIEIKKDPKGVQATVREIPLYTATLKTQNIGGSVNPAQSSVFRVASIPSASAPKEKRGSALPKKNYKRNGVKQTNTLITKARPQVKQSRPPNKTKQKAQPTQPKTTSPKKPKRDITKITTPKPKAKVQTASGTIDKKVGGGKVKPTEQTTVNKKARVRGENTAPMSRKGKMRGEKTTLY